MGETLPPHPRTLEEAITAALATGDEETAAAMLRRAFDRHPQADLDDLPELVEELAEYFASLERYEEAIAAAGHAALLVSGDGRRVLRHRARIAEILLRAGLVDEACAVYAGIAADTPGETWVHEAAGSGYVDAGEHELALAWLTAGLESAVANDEDVECIRRLCGLRRVVMVEMGLTADELDGQACARFTYPELDGPGSGRQTGDAELILVADALDEQHVARRSAVRLLQALREAADADADRTIVLPEPEVAEGRPPGSA